MSELTLQPIGIIRTPFVDKYAAPRQPGADGVYAIGKVVLEKSRNFEQALEDLDGFDKIWLIYQFDRNTNWKPKVLPPRSKVKRGVFATRAPHRPNPIGLSVVSLLEIHGRTLIVEGVDMLDNTPLFDIKPYVPVVESFPNAATGWLGSAEAFETPSRTFTYSNEALRQLSECSLDEQTHIRAHIERMLRFDIAPHPYKRISREPDGSYLLAYKSWRIAFSSNDDTAVTISSIRRS